MTRREEACRERPDLIGREIERDVSGEGIGGAALRFEFASDNRADRRNLGGEGDVELTARLDIILAAEVNLFMADEGADVRHLVHHVEQAREERVRDVDAVGRFTDVEVFPGRNVLFEIEGIDMA